MDQWIGNTKISRGLCPACSNPEMEGRAFPIVGDVIMVCTTCDQVYPNDRTEAWAEFHQNQGSLAGNPDADAAIDDDLHIADGTVGMHLRHEMSFQAFVDKEDSKTSSESLGNTELREIPTCGGTRWVPNVAEYHKKQKEDMANRFEQDFQRIKDMQKDHENPH
jgi:hypothetical protein